MSEIETKLEGIIAAVWLHGMDNDEAMKQITALFDTKQKERDKKVIKYLEKSSFRIHPDRSISSEDWNKGFRATSNTHELVVRLKDIQQFLSESEGGDE